MRDSKEQNKERKKRNQGVAKEAKNEVCKVQDQVIYKYYDKIIVA